MFTIICFSPTGNALYLAKLLATELNCPEEVVLPLEFTDPLKLKGNKHLILLYPVHGFNAPRIVKQFAASLPASLFEYVSLVSVGCVDSWHDDAVSSNLRKSFAKKGYPLVVDEVMAMPLSFIMNFPDEMNLKLIARAESRISELGKRISDIKESKKEVRFRSKVLTFMGRIEGPAARLFGLELHANRHCNSCGTCWSSCPARNIKEKSNGKPGFGFDCMMCMRCIYSCPRKAISPRFSKFIPLRNGYSLARYLERPVSLNADILHVPVPPDGE